MIKYLNLFRVKHWVKNFFIFIPLFFSSKFFEQENLKITFYSFLAFSLVTSFVYIINDILDIEYDKIHSEKKKRPIASGLISISTSLILGLISLIIGLASFYVLSVDALILASIYLLLNILYSFKLKHFPIVDFMIISIGFVIRVFIGGEVNSIELTNLIIIMVFLLSLFLAVSKRRDDVHEFEKTKVVNREVVKKYSLAFMDKIINIISSVLIVSYLLFITTNENISQYDFRLLFLTFFLVVMGVFRYNQITYVFNKAGSPIKIFYSDRFLQIILIIWLSTFVYTIYLN